jgi:hypothetical protein
VVVVVVGVVVVIHLLLSQLPLVASYWLFHEELAQSI